MNQKYERNSFFQKARSLIRTKDLAIIGLVDKLQSLALTAELIGPTVTNFGTINNFERLKDPW